MAGRDCDHGDTRERGPALPRGARPVGRGTEVPTGNPVPRGTQQSSRRVSCGCVARSRSHQPARSQHVDGARIGGTLTTRVGGRCANTGFGRHGRVRRARPRASLLVDGAASRAVSTRLPRWLVAMRPARPDATGIARGLCRREADTSGRPKAPPACFARSQPECRQPLDVLIAHRPRGSTRRCRRASPSDQRA